jgi:type VI secretion system secreted protein Hcp
MAQVDYFLKLDGIPGESHDSKHKNEIDIMAWSWGVQQAGTFGGGGGGGAGKASFQDLTVTKSLDKSSPLLYESCSTGKHIKSAVLVCRKAGGKQEEYMKVTLSDVLISSVNLGGSGGDLIPVEHVSINYAKIEVVYKEQTATGVAGAQAVFGWDVKQSAKA